MHIPGPNGQTVVMTTYTEAAMQVRSRPDHREADVPAMVYLRPIGTPLALGTLALGVASLVLSGLDLSWIDPTTNAKDAGLLILVFAVPAQFLASVLSFLARDSLAGTGFGVLASTWLATGLTLHAGRPGTTSGALGLLLLAAGMALLVPAFVSAGAKVTMAVVMAAAAARFFLTGAYNLSGAGGWNHASGICGLVVAGVGLYAAFAFSIEDIRKRTTLPIGRVGQGRTAIAGGFDDELEGVEHEAGVRRQL
jgi:succinate-acetate transporter protein